MSFHLFLYFLMDETGHRLVPSSGFFFGMTLDVLELQKTSVRLGGLQLLCLFTPWSSRGGKGGTMWKGRVLVNLVTLCVPTWRSG